MSKITWDNRENSGSKSNLNAVIFNETKESTNALYDIIEAQLGTTSSTNNVNLITSGNLLISGNLIPNTPSNDNTSSFTLGGEDNVWKEVFIGPSTIKYVNNNGDVTELSKNDVDGLKGGKFPVPPKTVDEKTFNNWEDLEIIFSKEDLYKNINLSEENEIKFVFRNNPFGQGNLNDPFIHINDNEHSIHIGNREATTTTYFYDNIETRNSGSFIISGTFSMQGVRGFPPPPLPGFYVGDMQATNNSGFRIVSGSYTGSINQGYSGSYNNSLPVDLVNHWYTPMFFTQTSSNNQGYNYDPQIFNDPSGIKKATYDFGQQIKILQDPPYNAGYTATCSFSVPFSASNALNQKVRVEVLFRPENQNYLLSDVDAHREFILKPENFPNGIVTGSFEGEIRIGRPLIEASYTQTVNEEGKPYISYTDRPVPLLDSPGGISLSVSALGLTDAFAGYFSPIQYSNPQNLPNPQPLINDGFHQWEIFIQPTWNLVPNVLSENIPGYTTTLARSFATSLGYPYPRPYWTWEDNETNLGQPLYYPTIEGTPVYLNNGILEQNYNFSTEVGGGTEVAVNTHNIFRVDNNDFYLIDGDISQSIYDNFGIPVPSSSNVFLYRTYSWNEEATTENTLWDGSDPSPFPTTLTGDGSEDVFHREYVVPTNVTQFKNNPYLSTSSGYYISNDDFPPYYSIPKTGSALVVSDTVEAPHQDIQLVVFKSPGKGTYEICADIDLTVWGAIPPTTSPYNFNLNDVFDNFEDTFTFKLIKQAPDGTKTTLAAKSVIANRKDDYTTTHKYVNANNVPFWEELTPIIGNDRVKFGYLNLKVNPSSNPEYEQYEYENQVSWYHYLHCWFYNTGPLQTFVNSPLLFYVIIVGGVYSTVNNGLTTDASTYTNNPEYNWIDTPITATDSTQWATVAGQGGGGTVFPGTSYGVDQINSLPSAEVVAGQNSIYYTNSDIIGPSNGFFSTTNVWTYIPNITPNLGTIGFWMWLLNPFSYFQPPGLPDGCDCSTINLPEEQREEAGCMAANPHPKCLSYELNTGDIVYMTVSIKNGAFFTKDTGGNVKRVKESDLRYVGFGRDTKLTVKSLPQFLENPVTIKFNENSNNVKFEIKNENYPGLSPLGCFEVDAELKVQDAGFAIANGGFLNLGTLYSENPNPPFTNIEGNFISCSADNVITVGKDHSMAGDGNIAIGTKGRVNGNNNLTSGRINDIDFSSNVAFGEQSSIIGIASLVQGTFTNISGSFSHAEGFGQKLIANSAHAQGTGHTVSGIGSHAEGDDNYTSPEAGYSHVEGKDNSTRASISHAEGSGSRASGRGSHAEGSKTITEGQGSHAEGRYTKTLGIYSHAEGSYTTASGNYSHAEGAKDTHAVSLGSHAEGKLTKALGKFSHTIGFRSTASANFSHAEGVYTNARGRSSHATGKETSTLGDYSHTGGTLTTSSGNYSHAEGFKTIANGDSSHAEGYKTVTINQDSHAEGQSTYADWQAHSEGLFTSASVAATHAEGYRTKADASYAHAEGLMTLADSAGAHTEGRLTTASGVLSNYSHAEGHSTIVSDAYAHAEGYLTTASGQLSHAEGNRNIASGKFSHAEGQQVTASGEASHGEGIRNTTVSDYSHAEGELNVVRGVGSHGEGAINTIDAIASYSHVEGYKNLVRGTYSHAEGWAVTASGTYSHAEGYLTQTTAPYAHSEGRESIAKQDASHASGLFTTASWDYTATRGIRTEPLGFTQLAASHHTGSLVVGRWSDNESMGGYNFTTSSKSQFVVGAGSSSNRRNLAEFSFEDILFNIDLLPTSNPNKIGQLYRDGGIIKISLG